MDYDKVYAKDYDNVYDKVDDKDCGRTCLPGWVEQPCLRS